MTGERKKSTPEAASLLTVAAQRVDVGSVDAAGEQATLVAAQRVEVGSVNVAGEQATLVAVGRGSESTAGPHGWGR